MIDQIHIKNFKSAKDLRIRTGPLTVLAGLNGSGKSTVLQAIAMIKQSLEANASGEGLLLRGDLVQLGKGADVQYDGANSDTLEFAFVVDGASVRLIADYSKDADVLTSRVVGDIAILNPLLGADFQFIQADRIVPASQYQQARTPDRLSGWLGCKGEFTVDFLDQRRDQRVSERRSAGAGLLDPRLLSQVAPTTSLLDQTAAWLQQLSPGVTLTPHPIEYADTTALRFQYKGRAIDSQGREHRPFNVGFGLTYCLPVIVACLAAPPGALLLLENPEAHLHPRGQAALGQLLAQCSADGVQIFVETHSDHVLNGIRVAVKQGSAGDGLQASKVCLNYFVRDVETGESHVEEPMILPDGQLDRWPEGFFDQWDRSLDELLD